MTLNSTDAARIAEVRHCAATGEARRIRLKSRLAIADVARALGTDPSTVSRWEAGQRRPRGAAALAYGRLLARLDKVAA